MKKTNRFSIIVCIACLLCTFHSLAFTNTTQTDDSTIVIGQVIGDKLRFVADIATVGRDLESFINFNATDKAYYTVINVQLVEKKGLCYLIATGERVGEKFRAALLLIKSSAGCLFFSGLTSLCMTSECENDKDACIPVPDDYCSNCPKSCNRITGSTPTLFFPSLPLGTCEK